MKKILALVLAVLMIAGCMVSVAAFDDVAADSKYAKAIDELQTQKVIQGVTETTFNPDALVTRWQMALFMARAASGITDDANWAEGAQLFTDCTNYLGAIQYCFSMGIIKGTTATTFTPDANITLRDGIIMAVRALGYEKEDEGLEASAKKYNVGGANYWVPYYQRANELGLLENLNDIAVDKALTRAQTAQLIYNMLYTKVYAKNGNDNNFTLNDIAFGGKKVVEVENSKNAWVVETPKFFFGTSDTLNDDAEEIVIAYIDDNDKNNKTVETFEVSFDDLDKYGVDVDNIDEYFGASLEIINYEEDDDSKDYSDYEYLTNFVKAEVVDLTQDDFVPHDDDDTRLKIGSKTHYIDDEKNNWVEIYTVDNASEEADEITFTAIDTTDDLEDVLFDAKAYDVDGDNYYEYVIVNFAYIDAYTEASTKGTEKFGPMEGVKDVVYSEELAEDDVFVYTYDAFSNTVTVKTLIEENVGKFTAYSQKKSEDKDGNEIVTGYVTIDGTKYTIEDTDVEDFFKNTTSLGDVDLLTALELRTESKAKMSETWSFYTYEGRIIAFGEETTEEDTINYTIVKDFTDFELYEYVVMTAVIDGADTDIKVNKIYTDEDGDGTWTLKHNIEKMGYSKLATALDDIAGIYSYTVDEDGMYTIKERELEYKMSDYLKEGEFQAEFSSYKHTNAIDREHQFRVNGLTQIYVITEDEDGFDVETIKPTSGVFQIPVTEDTRFYADYVGWGDPECKGCDVEHEIAHGATTVLYLSNTDVFDGDLYSVVFVEEAIADVEYGIASDFDLSDEDTEADYTKFEASGEAYILSTFADVDTFYVKGTTFDVLEPGAYLIDDENVVIGGCKSITELATAGTFEWEVDGGKIGFHTTLLKGSDIELYRYEDIRIKPFGMANNAQDTSDSKTKVKTVKAKDFALDTDETKYTAIDSSKTYTNDKLVKYLNETYPDGATVLWLGNDKTDKDSNGKFSNDSVAYPANTLTMVILDNLALIGTDLPQA